MLLGIFVGGKSERMGGKPKGLLVAPDSGEPLVVRTARLGRDAGLTPVLVGEAAAYVTAAPDLRVLADEPAGVGPLGGLGGLLAAAGHDPCVAVACDMPHLTTDILQRLVEYQGQAAVYAPSSIDGQRWEPLLARYDALQVRSILPVQLAMGVRSFQQLFGALAMEELSLSATEQRTLEDWDTPEDVASA